ncbi:TerC family protein [Coralloluteibacterium stylophorae]|uniref:TerC family protein n=1 Tax=Coralloluteibacterium stylophorae TaxID=1776034 RepID=A0AAP2FX52_9GAMM|nr:TerC family protein [Coralloluteibacterium stylophorae]MBS7456107.1 TerC family protein [Coralloluteibacterium stylophorae]
MEWIADPTAWMGLATLIVLEIILGIDNLVFIAILADKLPPEQRDRARIIGLGLALVMRLVLLAFLSWIMRLTEPLFEVLGRGFSGRDLILIAGGIFLLFKATMELHSRLEGRDHAQSSGGYASFGVVVTQIVVLDAVFSLDSVITAVGMVPHLSIMYVAVIVAMSVMILASKPLTRFVNAHPTVVMLCLGFLLMIGLSLLAEGFGFHLPKGYLYAAIGFSILIEVFNQLALRNRQKQARARPMRERTAEAVLKLLGSRPREDGPGDDADVHDRVADAAEPGFEKTERDMVYNVLGFADKPVEWLMTPRPDIDWLDLDDDRDAQVRTLRESPHSRIPVARGELDRFEGVVESRALLQQLLDGGDLDPAAAITAPLIVHESASALRVLQDLRRHPIPVAVVLDEYGSVEGLVTASDVLAAIVGDLADTRDPDRIAARNDDGSWRLDGGMPASAAAHLLDFDHDREASYHTLAGLLIFHLDHVPATGEALEHQGWRFEVVEMQGPRIVEVRAVPLQSAVTADPA